MYICSNGISKENLNNEFLSTRFKATFLSDGEGTIVLRDSAVL